MFDTGNREDRGACVLIFRTVSTCPDNVPLRRVGTVRGVMAFALIITFMNSGIPMNIPDLSPLHWRVSSFSGNNGTCVEVAALSDRHIALRNSRYPDAATIRFTRA